MRDITDALRKEAALCKGSNTLLHSRLHEARREIEYLRSIIGALNGLQDKDIAKALRSYVLMERTGHRPSDTHPIFRPSEVEELAKQILAYRAKRAAP
jgi:hypothetical protein